MMDASEHEIEIQRIVTAVLEQFAAALALRDLTPVQQKPRRVGVGDSYSVEFEIHFMRGSSIEDVLEFHVLENGRPTTSPAELESWLIGSVEDVIAQDDVTRTEFASTTQVSASSADDAKHRN